MLFADIRVGLVGPLAPPAGGMANQTRQLAELLRAAQAQVVMVQTNAPYQPPWVAQVPVVRAVFRLVPYLLSLWRAAGHCDVFHIMANSGWSWHLFATPAVWIARWRGVPVVVNYRGGEAAEFLVIAHRAVRFSMRRVSRLIVPSTFLQRVFARFEMPASVVPNIIDLARFHPSHSPRSAVHLLVARNLEPIYDNGTAVRAFARVHQCNPAAQLSIAGSGPLESQLRALAQQLGVAQQVHFVGRLDRDAMAALFRRADIMLNPSLADNMPNSVLEALASGVPVVSTNVGGVPFIVQDGVTALLVEPGKPQDMADACLKILSNDTLRNSLIAAGLTEVQRYTWDYVAPLLADVYRQVIADEIPNDNPKRVLEADFKSRMSLYTALVTKLLFPLQERLKRHTTVAVRAQMEDAQYWPLDRLAAWQAQRLKDLLVDASIHVPYYRKLFQELEFDAQAISGPRDLHRLPFLTKALIRANTDAIKHDQAQGLARFNTGGSSGEPLIFFIGTKRVSHDVAAKWRATRWWGVDIGDPEIVVWGSPIELGQQDRIKSWRDKLLRTQLLSAFEMSESKLDDFVATIRSVRPKMLFGYPSALSHIARHAQRRKVAMNDLGINVAFVTSERLYDDQRAVISQVFGCPVANGYGGRDAGFIAHQCPVGGMHITADDLIVEIVNESGEVQPAGVAGEIVVTHLSTNDFPFIRYRTGDIGVLDNKLCTCGRTLPLIKEIQGRSTDFVVALDGTVLHGLSLIYILRGLPGVKAFKVVQETLNLTRVQLVTDAEFTGQSVQTIQSGFKQRLGQAVAVEVDVVTSIPAEKSGKFRYIVSHVAGSQGRATHA